MGDRSAIEWTDATWNPVRGCAIVSKGCTNCYAMRQAHRSHGAGGAYEGLTKLTKGGPVWTGDIRLVPELLDQPRRWKQPRRIFVNSMSDLFHEGVPDEFIAAVFGVMASTPQHVFQILTKRAERMLRLLSAPPFEVLANVWLGVSVEDQIAADTRIPRLLATPAAVRWISAEPLLGTLNLSRYLGNPLPRPYPFLISPFDEVPRGLDWVVAGGESGPGARPMHPNWARSLRDQCARARVPFFFKQWGSWTPYCVSASNPRERDLGDVIMRRSAKKLSGRMLDGCAHDEYPA